MMFQTASLYGSEIKYQVSNAYRPKAARRNKSANDNCLAPSRRRVW